MRSSIFLVICSTLLLAAAPPAAARDSWTAVRSKNFLLVGDADEKEIRRAATHLEQFRDAFSRLFRGASFNASPVPTTVIVFRSDSAYRPYKPVYQGRPANVAGYCQPGPDVNYITLSAEREAEDPYSLIFHEYVHLLVNNTLGNRPAWLDEGLAEYYSTFDLAAGDKKAFLGRMIPSHVFRLRNEKMLPLDVLLSVDHQSPYYNERDKQSIFYAESWALVHYLILGQNRQRQPQFERFLDLLAANTPAEKAFRQAFQTGPATIEKELAEYIRRERYPEQTATFEHKPGGDAAAVQSAPLTAAEARAFLGDLLLHTYRLDEAETHLQQALALDPQLPMAHASLGLVRARQHRFGEATEHLRRAVTADPQNYLFHYYYAYVFSREGMDETQSVNSYPGEAARTMRAELRTAIRLAPSFPEAYYLLAFVDLAINEQLDEALGSVKQALRLSPGREDFILVLGQVYLRRRVLDRARETLQPLADNAVDPQFAVQARYLLQSIRAIEEGMARAKSTTASNRSEAPGEFEDTITEPAPTLDTALRKLRAGETRALGLLTRVDCSPQRILFSLKSGDRFLRLGAATFSGIQFVTYTPDVKGEITCGPRTPASYAVVTYRMATNPRSQVDGEIVAVEFVPNDFHLKDN